MILSSAPHLILVIFAEFVIFLRQYINIMVVQGALQCSEGVTFGLIVFYLSLEVLQWYWES